MVEGQGIPGLERYLADISFCTARTAEEYAAVFDLDLSRGMVTLDVGAGGSDFTARLLDLGIDAYALDPLYKARSQVRKKVKESSQLMIDSAADSASRIFFIERARQARLTIEKFAESIGQYPGHYIVGFATELPFHDETFDRVFSNNCVTEWLDSSDPMLFLGAVGQLLRVTKHGGVLQIHPFGEAKNPLIGVKSLVSDEELARRYSRRNMNYMLLLDLLKATQVPYEIVQTRDGLKTLVINKPELAAAGQSTP